MAAPPMRLSRSAIALLPLLLAVVWVVAFFHAVLSPSSALANRDIPLFHLPLRLSLRALAAMGPPTWNPWLHGGQPVLSNPNYAPFYPPTWLELLLPPAYALSWIAIAHMGLAFAGAWRLARQLGCRSPAAALAALGFSASGPYLSLLNSFTSFCGLAWLPWILALGFALTGRGEPAAAAAKCRPAQIFLLGLALALQFLSGEPVFTLISGLALLAIGLAAARRRPGALLHLAAAGVLAGLLAAVQLVPTLGRLADSPRAGGVAAEQATLWSMPPGRAIEVVFPRFFGDPARDQQGLFFGWGFHDRDFPYVASLYPGLLLALLGLAALLRWPIPRRVAWALTAGLAFFLALGRHNPLYAELRSAVPGLSIVRFPEKFAVLGVVALALAGALGWSWLLDERQAGHPERADFPLALGGCALATSGILVWLLERSPALAAWYVRAHGAPGMGPQHLSAATRFLRGEGWAALATAAAVVGLLALVRGRRAPRPLLEALALALVGLDLWHYGHSLIRTIPARAYSAPPPLAAELLPPRDRLYVEAPADGAPDLFVRTAEAGTDLTRAQLARLEPYSGVLWQIPYALHQDYDLMLTRWARRALTLLDADRGDRELTLRFLGAWNVGTVLVRKDPALWARQVARDPRALPVVPAINPYRLERFRFVPIVAFHRSDAEAQTYARAEGYRFDRREHCLRPDGPPVAIGYPAPPQLLSIEDRASRVTVRYRAAVKGACLVMAATYDRGWRARVDGAPTEIYPTVASQMAVLLPGGEHRLRLEYRDPLVPIGAAISLATLLGGALYLTVRRRRDGAGSGP